METMRTSVQRHIRYTVDGGDILAHVFASPDAPAQSLVPDGARAVTELSEQENAALEREAPDTGALALIDMRIAALERKQDRPLREIGLGLEVEANTGRLSALDKEIAELRKQRAAMRR